MESCKSCKRKISLDAKFCENCGTRKSKVEECHYCCEKNVLEVLECSHTICKECLRKLKNKACPECRNPIKNLESNSSSFVYLANYSNEDNNEDNFIKICNYCNSSSISYEGPPWAPTSVCNNCKMDDLQLITVQREGYNPHSVKTRAEVNPEMIKICNYCNSTSTSYQGPPWDRILICNNCKMEGLLLRTVVKDEYDPNSVKSRAEVNPETISVCNHCNSPNFSYKGPRSDWMDTPIVCNDCNRKNIKIVKIIKN